MIDEDEVIISEKVRTHREVGTPLAMQLEGTVTNVAAFGAFVDIGVHQDGLVHVSQLANRFVKDPHEVVRAGDVVQVRMTEVDVGRKRIGLSMRKGGGASASEDRGAARKQPQTPRRNAPGKSGKPPHGSGKKDEAAQRGPVWRSGIGTA